MSLPQYGSTHDDPYDDEELARKGKDQGTTATETSDSDSDTPPSNEYVLNVAFASFVGFTCVQAAFALIANSQSMLTDSAAMGVDALTYLFSMWAERIKNRSPTAEELQLPLAVREHRIEMKRLYLELIPPLISVSTMSLVTVLAVIMAWETLQADAQPIVNAGLMLCFSVMNLLLDLVNVICFARHCPYDAHEQSSHPNHCPEQYPCPDEQQELLNQQEQSTFNKNSTISSVHCSPAQHICIDTLRSIAVLVAAAIAYSVDTVSPAVADSCAAIVVSITTMISLIPLIRGLFETAQQIVIEAKNKPAFILETQGGTQYHL
ncbi:expressed unknown protein [Seminavis robusta]|uniref:Cation efflux protein transmembrane domain-containing protein n=1 Tax=Seminavis robusta TaxID=568900 RepID=A0A9N8DF73_9STRA|nr:expressed unknown protein [Seminavis robusta]|eukprot:Sro89_g046910.1 n/a (321) ;mRNA; f:51449-52411